RGVRVGTFDWSDFLCAESKNHRADAVALASKALAAPGIVAEVCISDDEAFGWEHLIGLISFAPSRRTIGLMPLL
ncbi:8-amino-7-oxononanoate synthase, partial [Bacteroides fragilis]|nr:8-amino-7-oxononanoate synthase [Bacteroides fragilis]